MLRLLDLQAIDAALARAPRPGGPLLRTILEDWRPHEDPVLRSDPEAALLALVTAHGLPAPLCNQKLTIAERSMEVDLLWSEHRLVVEHDGRGSHETPVAFERDRRRDRDLMRAGYRVLRVTWKQLIREPDEIGASIAELLSR